MNWKIPQLVPYIGEEELKNLKQVIETKWVTEGPFTETLIEKIKQFTRAEYVLPINNGTLALYLSLKAIGVMQGDEVIVPDFTFNASASSVAFTGAVPVFVDVNKDDFSINIDQIADKITSNTKAIMPVHIYGQSVDMEPIIEIAKKNSLKIIEDAAQGYGVLYKGNHVGTIGDIGIISFFADKTITMGEGAVILTNDEKLYHTLRQLRNQGRMESGSFMHSELGMNFRITDLQSAVGVAQIEKFSEIKQRKLDNYNLYRNELYSVRELSFMKDNSFSNFIPFRVAIKTSEKERLMKYLEENGIQTRGFFYPLHRQPCFNYLGYETDSFPVTNTLYDEGICLPVFCDLQRDDIVYVCNCIKKFYTE